MMRGLVTVVTACLLLSPAALAQDVNTLDVSFEGGERELTPGESTSIPVRVDVGCGLILSEGTAGSLSIGLEHNLPANWTVSTPGLTVTADQGCLLNTGVQNATGTLSVTPGVDAPGLQPVELELTARAGNESARSDDSGRFYVAYQPGHSISPTISFPHTMTNDDGDALRFNLTITVTANADTTVMFTDVAPGGGTITGLDAQAFAISEDADATRVVPVAWTPPDDWDNATISFRHASHCTADGFACDPTGQRNVSWEVTNGQSSGGGKSSPGIAPVVTVGLVALAAWLARR